MENLFLSSILMSTSDKVQFKMTLSSEMEKRLKDLAVKFGKNSGQEVVLELLNIYLPVWVSLNDSMGRATQHQLKIITESTEYGVTKSLTDLGEMGSGEKEQVKQSKKKNAA